jgi:hypothetical protein
VPKSTSTIAVQRSPKYERVGGANQSGSDVFLGCTADALREAVSIVTADGDGITFSRTRAGGAVCVAVLSDGTVSKWYAASGDELTGILQDLTEACVSAAG